MRDSDNKSLYSKYESTFLIFGVIFIILLGGWIGMKVFCDIKAGSERVYTFSGADINSEQEGLSMTVEKTKIWKDMAYHEDNPFGIQYDVLLHNTSGYDFTNWSCDITFTENVIIDSSWNGELEANGKTLHYISREPVEIVPAEDEKGFGAVIYQKRGNQVESITVRGFWTVDPKETGWFWVMAELSALYVLALVVRIIGIIRTKNYLQKLERDATIIEQSMKTLTEFIDAKDAYTKDHSARVAMYAREIGRRYGLGAEEIKNLYYITLLHDCGKIAVPDEILKKEGILTPDEFAVIKTHTTKGKELLKKFNALEGISDGAHYHHERYDGYGYPSGLEGEEIPLVARIICVADAYDAMSSNRCYRKALDKDKILSELKGNSGKQFDPKFVPIMIAMIEDGFVDKVKEKYPSN